MLAQLPRTAFRSARTAHWHFGSSLRQASTQAPSAVDPFDRSAIEEARKKLEEAGLDPTSFWEQPIMWGDQDSFKHVNNVQYLRFFEASRFRWMGSLGNELGGPAKAEAMFKGQGVSLILKSIEVQFRRPVTYPDSLLVGCRPKLSPSESTGGPPGKEDRSILNVAASIYSVAQRAFVAHSCDVLVWYDYDQLKKCDPGDAVREVVRRRVTGNKEN